MTRNLAIAISALAFLFIGSLSLILCAEALPGLIEGKIFQPGYWDYRSLSFNALSMFYGTAVVSTIALVFAVPLGLGTAIFLSEYLRDKTRSSLKIALELLAGIPSVVYGLLGVAYLIPVMRSLISFLGGDSADSLLTAGILLGVMILPTFLTFADDALRTVPQSWRHQGAGLGLTKVQTILFVVIPKAKPGIFGAGMLALGRALGETIAIFLVVGRADQPFSWRSLSLDSILTYGQTVTTKLGGSELSIAYGDPKHWASLMALGVCLWVAVGGLSFLSQRIRGDDPF